MMMPTTSIQQNGSFGNRFSHTMYQISVYRQTRGKIPGIVGSQVVYEQPKPYCVIQRPSSAFWICHINFLEREEKIGCKLMSRHATMIEAHDAGMKCAVAHLDEQYAARAAANAVKVVS